MNTSGTLKGGRIPYVDFLRILASVAVIAIHAYFHYFGVSSILHTYTFDIVNIAKSLTQFAVPMFFMISGAMLLSGPDESYSVFIKKRLNKVLIPFISWSVLYYVFYTVRTDAYNFNPLHFIRLFASQGISGHLWFMYAIIPLYFLIPVIRKALIYITKKDLQLLILWLFVLGSVLPFLNTWLKFFNVSPISVITLYKFGAYLDYMLIGYYLYKYPISRIVRNTLYFAGIASIAAMFIVTRLISVDKALESAYTITHPQLFFYTAALFILGKAIFENRTISEKTSRVLMKLGNLSFGAYLVHMMVLRMLQQFLPKKVVLLSNTSALLYITAIFIAGTLISYLISFIISKIKYIRRII